MGRNTMLDSRAMFSFQSQLSPACGESQIKKCSRDANNTKKKNEGITINFLFWLEMYCSGKVHGDHGPPVTDCPSFDQNKTEIIFSRQSLKLSAPMESKTARRRQRPPVAGQMLPPSKSKSAVGGWEEYRRRQLLCGYFFHILLPYSRTYI